MAINNMLDRPTFIKSMTKLTEVIEFYRVYSKEYVNNLANEIQSEFTENFNKHNTRITALETNIALKLDKSNFESFKASNTTAINNAKSNAISTAATDATNKANKALSDAKAYTDSIRVGGRNYIKDSKSYTHSPNGSDNLDLEFKLYTSAFFNNLKETDKITLSFYVRAKSNLSSTFESNVWFRQSPWNSIGAFSYPAGTTEKKYYSFTINGQTIYGQHKNNGFSPSTLFVRYMKKDTVQMIYENVKIELGGKPTDWTPAPEDVETAISNSQTALQANIDKKSDKGHAHDDRYYTESEIDSKLDTKAVNKTLSNENLNNVIIPGFYNAGGSNTCTNKPSGINAFGLEVIHTALGGYYTQVLYDGDVSDKIFVRHSNAGTWTAWEQTVTNSLTSTSTTSALSANQGKILNEGKLMHKTISTATDFDTLTENGVYHIPIGSCPNAPNTYHGTLFVDTSVDTPYQIFEADAMKDRRFKRTKSSGVWSAWTTQWLTDTTYTALKNPNALKVQFNGTDKVTYDGSSAQTVNITPTAVGTKSSADIDTAISNSVKSTTIINQSTDWNTITEYGTYKVQTAGAWGDASKLHSPNQYSSDLYAFGLCQVIKSGTEAENRTLQIYYPHITSQPVLMRMLNSTGWHNWHPLWQGAASASHNHDSVYSKLGHTHDDRYYTETEIDNKLSTAATNANSYTDTKISNLINGAPSTLDTLKEIADTMKADEDVVAALDEAVGKRALASDLTSHVNDKNNPHGITAAQVGAVAKAGDTLTGALNFANNVWNIMGDDAYIGDCNSSGRIGIKGKNGATGIYFAPYSGSTAQTITINGSGIMTISGTVTSTFSGNLTGNVSGNATSSSRLGINSSTNASDEGGLTWFDISGTAGAAVNANDTPTTDWWYILRNRHRNTSANYYTDVAIPFNRDSIYYKRVTNGSKPVNERWIKIIDDLNYSSYALPLTGGTITGLLKVNNILTLGSEAVVRGSGQYNYCVVARIYPKNKYINIPIAFEISGRGITTTMVEVMFQNTNLTDPNVTYFATSDYQNFYIIKEATSQWAIYAAYTESWGSLYIHKVTGSGLSIGYKIVMENASAIPEGAIKATYKGKSAYSTSSDTANRLNTFSASGTSYNWGTLTTANGYSNLGYMNQSGGGSIGWGEKSGQTSVQINGIFYQNEGKYAVLDTGNYVNTLNSVYAPIRNSLNYVRVYNSNNVGTADNLSVDDIAKQHNANGMVNSATHNPTGAKKWVHVWSQAWTNNNIDNWVSQIAIGVNDSNGMWYRTSQGKIVDATWKRVLDSSNYNSYALPLTGGALSGTLTLKGSQYTDAYGGALNANNSNIYGVNSIYTADVSDNAQEGIHFYRDSTHVDTIWINSGNLYFAPNRQLGTNGTSYKVLHENNYSTSLNPIYAKLIHHHDDRYYTIPEMQLTFGDMLSKPTFIKAMSKLTNVIVHYKDYVQDAIDNVDAKSVNGVTPTWVGSLTTSNYVAAWTNDGKKIQAMSWENARKAANAPKKDGTDATGTWGIGISGNAATSTLATSVKDKTNSTATYLNYGASGLGASGVNWFAAWNNYELRAISPANLRQNISALSSTSANGYEGMGRKDGNTSDWIRTTSNGLIPYQSGGRGSGHSSLGTSSWYFKNAYVDNIYSSDVKAKSLHLECQNGDLGYEFLVNGIGISLVTPTKVEQGNVFALDTMTIRKVEGATAANQEDVSYFGNNLTFSQIDTNLNSNDTLILDGYEGTIKVYKDILPLQVGAIGSGHGSIGSASNYFKNIYVDYVSSKSLKLGALVELTEDKFTIKKNNVVNDVTTTHTLFEIVDTTGEYESSAGNESQFGKRLSLFSGSNTGAMPTFESINLNGATGVIKANKFDGKLQHTGISKMWYEGRDGAILKTTTKSGYSPLWSAKTDNGSWDAGAYSDNIFHLNYITDANYNSKTNTQTANFQFRSNGILWTKYLRAEGYISVRPNGEGSDVAKVIIGNDNVNGNIELYGTNPFIDFHLGNSTADYTHRLIELNANDFELQTGGTNNYFKVTAKNTGFAAVGVDNGNRNVNMHVNAAGTFCLWDQGNSTNIFYQPNNSAVFFPRDIVIEHGSNPRLTINNTANDHALVKVQNTTGACQFQINSGAAGIWVGRVEGTNYSDYMIYANKNKKVYVPGYTASDRRMKENIKDTSVNNALSQILNIKHKEFDWKTDHSHIDLGYIAQELEEINPNMVFAPDENSSYYSVNMFYMTSLITKGIQELDEKKSDRTEVEELKQQIKELKKQLKKLSA